MTSLRPHYASPPPPRRANRRLREVLAIGLIVLIAGVAVGGGYWLANGNSLPFGRVFALGQPTPVPTLAPLDALTRIQALYPAAAINVSSPISDEVDLTTTDSHDAAPTLTTTQQTQILSLYLRGYSGQTFWRWRDTYTPSNTMVVYEVHSSELWVITVRPQSCSLTWLIYAITPQTLIARGAAGNTDYVQGIASHMGVGAPPDGLTACG